MEIDPSAPAIAHGEAFIEARPEAVFAVSAAIDDWPRWNTDVKSVELDGRVVPGTTFRWRTGSISIASELAVVDPPREIGWTGSTMGIRAAHVFRFEARAGGTLARSEESWEGWIPSLLKGYSRRTLEKALTTVLADLKAAAERKAPA